MKRFDNITPRGAPALGQGTLAKIAFLQRAMKSEDGAVAVNLPWTLQMNPHGKRFLRQGLFTSSRRACLGRKSMTLLTITDKGRAEFARLARRHKLNA